LDEEDDEGDLGEDNFLDSPLDRIEPYQMFKSVLLRKFSHVTALGGR
jgi:hypothetical protein